MSSDKIAIHVEQVSKRYEIYDAPRDRLKQFLLPRLRKAARLTPRDYFHEFWALRDVSFDVKKGETVGIVGRNGSGKSTLLQIICGTLSPTSGWVQTSGRIAALLELGSGFNPEFTGHENIYLNGTILGLSQREIDKRYDDIAAFADIGEFINHPVKTYSSGMQVRLAFAVQAMVDPDVLIVDEALAVGDERFQRKCFARLEKLKDNGTSILFVSHSAAQVVELCDRALFLEHGERMICAHPLPVTRAYQALIYAPPDEQATLIQRYRAADEADIQLLEMDQLGAPADVTRAPGDATKDASIMLKARFDPGLISASKSIHPKQGAEIDSIEIFDSEGDLVNVLQPAQDYRFVVTGKFLSPLSQVHIGIHIRTVSGMTVTGQRYPCGGRHVSAVKPGQAFVTTFHFKMLIVPGTYFVGAGVWAEQGAHCAHRILDALVIRVDPLDDWVSFGYADASFADPLFKLT